MIDICYNNYDNREVFDMYNNIPDEYKPISAWGYFGYNLLFNIPLVGFIVLLVFALGGSNNINVRNFARSYFCYYILGAVVAVIILIVVVTTGALSQIWTSTTYQ